MKDENQSPEQAGRLKDTLAWRNTRTGEIVFLQRFPRGGWTKYEVWVWDKKEGTWTLLKSWGTKIEYRKAVIWLTEYAEKHNLEALYESEIHQK